MCNDAQALLYVVVSSLLAASLVRSSEASVTPTQRFANVRDIIAFAESDLL